MKNADEEEDITFLKIHFEKKSSTLLFSIHKFLCRVRVSFRKVK